MENERCSPTVPLQRAAAVLTTELNQVVQRNRWTRPGQTQLREQTLRPYRTVQLYDGGSLGDGHPQVFGCAH